MKSIMLSRCESGKSRQLFIEQRVCEYKAEEKEQKEKSSEWLKLKLKEGILKEEKCMDFYRKRMIKRCMYQCAKEAYEQL